MQHALCMIRDIYICCMSFVFCGNFSFLVNRAAAWSITCLTSQPAFCRLIISESASTSASCPCNFSSLHCIMYSDDWEMLRFFSCSSGHVQEGLAPQRCCIQGAEEGFPCPAYPVSTLGALVGYSLIPTPPS